MARKLILSGALVLALTLSPAAVAQPRPTYGDGLEVPSACEGARERITDRSRTRARRAILCLIGDLRSRQGVGALQSSSKLGRASLAHTRDMVRRGYFGHTGPGGPTLQQRLRRVKYRSRSVGESLALMANATPVGVVNTWIGSNQHWRNMTSSRYTHVGIGILAKAALRRFARGGRAATVTLVVGPRA